MKQKKQGNYPSAEEKALELFTNAMIAKIEEINKDWKKPWFTDCIWPKNLYGREYGYTNAFMLILNCEKQGYKIPVFCTFDTVKYLNFQKDGNVWKKKFDKDGNELPKVYVKKGEKSFPIFLTTYTVVNKETKEKTKYETYKQLSDDEKEKYDVYPKMQVYNVFNIAQTNLDEARPKLYEKIINENTPKTVENRNNFIFGPLDKMIYGEKWLCPIKPTYQNKAYYSPKRDEIVIPIKEQFMAGEDYYATCLHEMIHSTGAKGRLGRLAGNTDEKSYAREELVAEMGAALVAQRYGIVKHIKEDSAAYLKAWIDELHETPKFIKTVLLDVKRASYMITEVIDNVAVAEEKECFVNI